MRVDAASWQTAGRGVVRASAIRRSVSGFTAAAARVAAAIRTVQAARWRRSAGRHTCSSTRSLLTGTGLRSLERALREGAEDRGPGFICAASMTSGTTPARCLGAGRRPGDSAAVFALRAPGPLLARLDRYERYDRGPSPPASSCGARSRSGSRARAGITAYAYYYNRPVRQRLRCSRLTGRLLRRRRAAAPPPRTGARRDPRRPRGSRRGPASARVGPTPRHPQGAHPSP